MTLRGVLYLRVSQDTRGRFQSVSEQDGELREACDERDIDVAKVVTDNDLSASEYATKDRPGFLDVRELVASGSYDVVGVWEGSRISRIMSVYVAFRDLCRKHDTKVYVLESDRLYDFSRPADRRAFLDEGADSEQESGRSSRRIQRAVRARAAAGKPHGRLLYGYRREYAANSGELLRQVIDEDKAPYVDEAAKRFLAGESLYVIAGDFNERNVPAPHRGVWDMTRVRRLLTNPGYIAKRHHKGQLTADAQWEPILDEGDYWAIQAKLADPQRRQRQDNQVIHLLSGIAVCGVEGCGAPMRVVANRGYPSYTCWSRYAKTSEKRFHTSRAKSKLEPIVERALGERLSRPDAEEWLARNNGADDQAGEAYREAEEKQARLDGFYDAGARGDLSPAALARIEQQLQPEIDAARERIKRVRLPGVLADLVRTTPEEVEAAWRELSLPQQREVLRSLMTIRVLPVGAGQRTASVTSSVQIRFIGDD